jgi:hypothetical protein
MRNLIAVVVVLLGAGAAIAAPPDPAIAKSKELFTHAESLYALTRFDEALAEYERAFEAKPLPGFLFNIGQCHRQLGHWDKAAYFYRTYLDREHDAKNRGLVESLIVEMEGKARTPTESNPIVPPPNPQVTPQANPDGGTHTEPIPANPPPQVVTVVAPKVEKPPIVPPPGDDRPLYRRPVAWAVAGAVVVVVAALAIGLGVGLSGGLPHGTLSTIDAR